MKEISQLKQKERETSEPNKKKKERQDEEDWIMVVWEGLRFPT